MIITSPSPQKAWLEFYSMNSMSFIHKLCKTDVSLY
jgi:hypothetical protein